MTGQNRTQAKASAVQAPVTITQLPVRCALCPEWTTTEGLTAHYEQRHPDAIAASRE
jgi:hypothetical protein